MVDVPDSPSAVADADDDVVVVAASAPPCRVLHDSDDDVHCLPAAPATQGGRRRAIVLDDDDDDDLAAVPAPATGARGAVPAAVQDAVPAAFEDADEDGPDDVVAECERISGDLRAALGSGLAPDGRFAATDAAPAALATRDDLVAAAGPGSAAGTLKPYQVVGVNFLLLLKNTGIGGAIVADEARRQWSCGGEGGGGVAVVACACPAPTCFRPHQPTRPPPAHPFRQMGVGKTAQAAVFLAVRAAQYGDGPFLVVVPSSLLDNWARELAAWAPSLRVARFYGPHRAAVRRVAAGGGPDSGFDVMLVSYPMFERAGDGAKLDRVFVRKFAWSIAVLDEAHAVKNAGSGRSARLRAVVEGADMRVLLTGTPLQNQASELRALLAFMLPTLFGAEGGVDDADAVDAGLGSAAAVTRLRRTLAPFILRRLKTEVASQLVAKTRETRRVALTDAQADAYVAAVAALRAEAQAAVARGGEGEAGDAGLAPRCGHWEHGVLLVDNHNAHRARCFDVQCLWVLPGSISRGRSTPEVNAGLPLVFWLMPCALLVIPMRAPMRHRPHLGVEIAAPSVGHGDLAVQANGHGGARVYGICHRQRCHCAVAALQPGPPFCSFGGVVDAADGHNGLAKEVHLRGRVGGNQRNKSLEQGLRPC